MRTIGAVLAGLLAWIAIATLGNLVLRHGSADYAAVEKAMTFTLPMLVARLVLGAVSSLGAGALAAGIDRGRPRAERILAVVLLVLFVPLHYSLWQRFPAWYHLVFLVSLPVLSITGGVAYRRARASRL